jgi:hypothetical protein
MYSHALIYWLKKCVKTAKKWGSDSQKFYVKIINCPGISSYWTAVCLSSFSPARRRRDWFCVQRCSAYGSHARSKSPRLKAVDLQSVGISISSQLSITRRSYVAAVAQLYSANKKTTHFQCQSNDQKASSPSSPASTPGIHQRKREKLAARHLFHPIPKTFVLGVCLLAKTYLFP